MVRRILDRFAAIVTEEGLDSACARVALTVKRAFREPATDKFDTALNTDTSKAVSLWRLKIPSENVRYGSEYRTTNPSVFLGAIRTVPEDLRKLSFVDLGCGKGRTLILAAKEGFKTVTGVEFSPELAAIARRNLGQVSVTAEIVEADASQFCFPDEDLLIYMYNPFGRSVMESVAGNLIGWHRRSARTAFVVYVNPVSARAFDSCIEFEPVAQTNEARVWKLHSQSI